MNNHDNRTALSIGSRLTLALGDGGTAAYIVGEAIGFGGSCIVYSAKKEARGENAAGSFARSQIIKEFYPLSVEGITRTDGALEIPEAARAAFDELKAQFLRGSHLFEEFYELDSSHVLARPFSFGEASGTAYAVSDPSFGATLKESKREPLSLYQTAELMFSLCEAAENFHENGLLYLDFKPDNIFEREIDGHRHIALFDFDTVISVADIKERNYKYSTYSDGWAPPEQKQWLPDKLGATADVFSLGAVFFWLLTGDKPVINKRANGRISDLEAISSRRFNLKKAAENCKKAPDSVIEQILEILRGTLQISSDSRIGSAAGLKKEFQKMKDITMSDAENKYLSEQGAEIKSGIDSVGETAKETNLLLRDVKKSLDEKAVGNRHGKILAFALAAVLVVALIVGASLYFGKTPESGSAAELEADFDAHTLLKLQIDLENAVHLYDMGLNNWRRLDYPRAERDIKAARDEISMYKSQATLELAKVNNSLGCLYLDMGRYANAYDLLNSAHSAFVVGLGAESLEARAVKASIARYDYYTGSPEQALRTTQEIIDASDTEKEKVIAASTGHFRAQILDGQGRYDEALAAYENVLALYQEFLQNRKLSETLAKYTSDPKVDSRTKDYYTTSLKWIIMTFNNMGEVYLHMENYAGAQIVLDTALQMSLDNIYIGKDNLNTAAIYANLAELQCAEGELKAAISSIETAIAIQKRRFGYDDKYPGLVVSYITFAEIRRIQGDFTAAEQLLKDALNLAEESFGENHPQTAAVCNAFGEYFIGQRNGAAAVSYLERAVEIQTATLSVMHPDTAKIYLNLALAYEFEKRLPEAVAAAFEADGILEELDISGDISEQVLKILRRLYYAQSTADSFDDWRAAHE